MCLKDKRLPLATTQLVNKKEPVNERGGGEPIVELNASGKWTVEFRGWIISFRGDTIEVKHE